MRHTTPWGLLALALLLDACVSRGAGRATTPLAVKPAAQSAAAKPPAPALAPHVPTRLSPLPQAAARAFEATLGGASLNGSVGLRFLQGRGLAEGASRVLSAAGPEAAARVLLRLGRLDGVPYALDGQVAMTTSAANGSFQFNGQLPTDRSVVVTAILAQGHQLSSIVPVGATSTELDEATSMLVETARWQLRPDVGASSPALGDLDASTWADLVADAHALVASSSFEDATAPTGQFPVLKAGAGRLLRHRYVEAFGARVSATGASNPPEANRSSDAWLDLLGHRPLAITPLAGNGERTAGVAGTGVLGESASLARPGDAQAAANGDVYLSERDTGRILFLPSADRAGPILGVAGPFLAGRVYPLVGQLNADLSVAGFNTNYANGTVGGLPPALSAGLPLLAAGRTLVVPGAGEAKHLIVAASFAHRVFFLPDAAATAYGLSMQAHRLYTLAGSGTAFPDASASGVGALASTADLDNPEGLALDGAGNLYILEAGGFGTPRLRVVRHSDGLTTLLPFTLNGEAYALGRGGSGLALAPEGNALLLADAARHVLLSIPLPSTMALAALNAGSPNLAPVAASVLVGELDTAGFIKESATNYPGLYQVALPAPAFSMGGQALALLNRPTAVVATAEGDVAIADAGNRRVRLLRSGQLSTLLGGFAVDDLRGDARLCDAPDLAGLTLSPEGDLLVLDRSANRVRRLHTRRGALGARVF